MLVASQSVCPWYSYLGFVTLWGEVDHHEMNVSLQLFRLTFTWHLRDQPTCHSGGTNVNQAQEPHQKCEFFLDGFLNQISRFHYSSSWVESITNTRHLFDFFITITRAYFCIGGRQIRPAEWNWKRMYYYCTSSFSLHILFHLHSLCIPTINVPFSITTWTQCAL